MDIRFMYDFWSRGIWSWLWGSVYIKSARYQIGSIICRNFFAKENWCKKQCKTQQWLIVILHFRGFCKSLLIHVASTSFTLQNTSTIFVFPSEYSTVINLFRYFRKDFLVPWSCRKTSKKKLEASILKTRTDLASECLQGVIGSQSVLELLLYILPRCIIFLLATSIKIHAFPSIYRWKSF